MYFWTIICHDFALSYYTGKILKKRKTKKKRQELKRRRENESKMGPEL